MLNASLDVRPSVCITMRFDPLVSTPPARLGVCQVQVSLVSISTEYSRSFSGLQSEHGESEILRNLNSRLAQLELDTACHC